MLFAIVFWNLSDSDVFISGLGLFYISKFINAKFPPHEFRLAFVTKNIRVLNFVSQYKKWALL
jgi:hypothetical protein